MGAEAAGKDAEAAGEEVVAADEEADEDDANRISSVSLWRIQWRVVVPGGS